jgi:hypothetical protein
LFSVSPLHANVGAEGTHLQRASTLKELASLKCDKKETHNALMKEQKRAAKSKVKGQKSID